MFTNDGEAIVSMSYCTSKIQIPLIALIILACRY